MNDQLSSSHSTTATEDHSNPDRGPRQELRRLPAQAVVVVLELETGTLAVREQEWVRHAAPPLDRWAD
jgi:hypothetical protein